MSININITITDEQVAERVKKYNHDNWDWRTGEGKLEDERWVTVQLAGEAILEWVRAEGISIDEGTEEHFIEWLIELGNEFRMVSNAPAINWPPAEELEAWKVEMRALGYDDVD